MPGRKKYSLRKEWCGKVQTARIDENDNRLYGIGIIFGV